MEEFIERLKIALSEHYGDKGEVFVTETKKNNGVCLHSISLKKDGCNISPMIYAEQVYSDYQNGVSFEEIVSDMIEVYDNSDSYFDINRITDFEKVKDSITFRLINRERNDDYLKDKIFVNILDLAVVFDIYIKLNDCDGRITVTKEMYNLWGTSEAELLDLSNKNTRRLYGIRVMLLSDLLDTMLDKSDNVSIFLESPDVKKIPLFTFTNERYYSGAGCMLYLDVLKNVAEKLEDDLFIIPSSVHECLLYPASLEREGNTLKSIIKSTNEEQVPESDFLSDNLYLFRRSSGELEIVK